MADIKLRICLLICLMSIISASSVIPSAITHVSSFIPDLSSQLSTTFYVNKCPGALLIIKEEITRAVLNDRRLGASLLRLHFHDCFVQGCDASVLLKDTPNFKGEQNARPNANSLRGYEIIDKVKAILEMRCPNVVSCADILAVSARDSVVALGGPIWPVRVGRKDSTTANLNAANLDLPSPFLDLNGLIAAFKKKGFSTEEMVALSGSHTIGQTKCALIRPRIYNERNVQSQYRISLQKTCPKSGGDNNLSPLDATTPNFFDNAYYKNLIYQKGLLHSDQQLYNDGSGPLDYKVSAYASDPLLFRTDFANAMVKMGNLSPLTGNQGQIRKFCSIVNKVY